MEKLEELRDRKFIHTKLISLDFLRSVRLYDEFTKVFEKMGWDKFWNLSNVKGSKILTLEFLSTLRITKEKIYFTVLNSEFDLPWDAFSTCLGFDIPNIKIEHATKHMHKKEFWYDITGENCTHASYRLAGEQSGTRGT